MLTQQTVRPSIQYASATPSLAAVVEFAKPITWFPPMWAFACGVVSAGFPVLDRLAPVALGVLVAGPGVCAASQMVNDWFDRHVDAMNEPGRPVPSGRIPGRWGLYLAVAWTALSLAVATGLGRWGFAATAAALALAWMYSAPPFRLKRNGWVGNAAVGVTYEGLAWVTGAAVAGAAAATALDGGAAPALPNGRVLLLAALYSAGAHGIMTLNDFKSIRGDYRAGIRSLPVRLGAENAARVACAVMLVPQLAVVALLARWDATASAVAVAALVAAQLPLMRRLLARPTERARWYSGFGVPLYVLGMMAAAAGLRALAGSA